jgi:hypothetical protein
MDPKPANPAGRIKTSFANLPAELKLAVTTCSQTSSRRAHLGEIRPPAADRLPAYPESRYSSAKRRRRHQAYPT